MVKFHSIWAGLFLAVAGLGPVSGPSHAVLIDNGTTTLDTDTNLEWLDVKQSTNRSYNDVAGQFGAGGDFEGWRHATYTEMNALFVSMGYSSSYSSSPATIGMLSNILLFGNTSVTSTAVTAGFFDDSPVGTVTASVGYGYLINGNSDEATLFADLFTGNTSADAIGNWLVRNSAFNIPAPGGILILGLALGGLAYRRRARQRR